LTKEEGREKEDAIEVNSTKDLGAARRLLLASVFVLVNVNLRLGLLDLSLRQFVS